MKCLSCDVILSDYEAIRKSEVTGDFFDLCNQCFAHIEEDLGYCSDEELEDDYDYSAETREKI